MIKYSTKSRRCNPSNALFACSLLVLSACSGDGRPFTEAVEANDLQLKTLSVVQPVGLLPDLVVNPGTQFTLGLNATNLADEKISVSSTNRRWSVKNAAGASSAVASIDEHGNLTALSAGTALVTVRIGSVGSLDFEVEVRQEELESIASIEGDESMERCVPKEYRAIGRFVSADGSTESLRALPNAEWTVGDITFGSVTKPLDGFASATGVNEGMLNLIATVDGKSGNKNIAVEGNLQSLTVGPENTAVTLGNTLSLVASGTYATGTEEGSKNVDITKSVHWSVDEDNDVFSIGNTVFNKGIVTPLIIGTKSVSVSCGNLVEQRPVTVIERGSTSDGGLSFFDTDPLKLPLSEGSKVLKLSTGSSYNEDNDVTNDAQWRVLDNTDDIVTFDSALTAGTITPLKIGKAKIQATYVGRVRTLNIEVTLQ